MCGVWHVLYAQCMITIIIPSFTHALCLSRAKDCSTVDAMNKVMTKRQNPCPLGAFILVNVNTFFFTWKKEFRFTLLILPCSHSLVERPLLTPSPRWCLLSGGRDECIWICSEPTSQTTACPFRSQNWHLEVAMGRQVVAEHPFIYSTNEAESWLLLHWCRGSFVTPRVGPTHQNQQQPLGVS